MKKIFLILIITLLIDFILSQLFILDFLNKERNKKFEGDTENRIHNTDYLYTFKKNSKFKSRFYDFQLDLYTNDLGFRSFDNKNIDRSKDFSLVMGDSFIEGVGVSFDKTIVGQLNKKAKKQKILVSNQLITNLYL